MLDIIILNDELYRQFENNVDATERSIIQKGVTKEGPMANLVSLGFADVSYFDGVEVTYEYGVPATEGYGIALEQLELMSLQPQLFVATGPIYDEATMTYRFTIDFFGNLRAKNPKFFVKWNDLT